MTKTKDDLKRDKPRYPKQKLVLQVPYIPSVNHMYYNTKFGGKRLTKQAEQWFKHCTAYVKDEMKKQKWQYDEGNVWHEVHFDFYMPDKRIRDTHNTFKIMMDVLDRLVFSNDYYAKPHVNKVELDKENPRIIITIFPEKYIERG